MNQAPVGEHLQGRLSGSGALHHGGQVERLALAQFGGGSQVLQEHLNLALRPGQGYIGELDAVGGGQFGLFEGLTQVLATIGEQQHALGALVREEGQAELQGAGDVGAEGDWDGVEAGQAAVLAG